MAPPILHSISTPRMNASNSSTPLTRRSCANANSAGAIGAVGWMTVGTWVSQKSKTLAAAALRKAALSASMRSQRPIRVACWRPENSARDCRATSMGGARQPASATAKKFMSARLASCRAVFGTPSQRASTAKRARVCVTAGACCMERSHGSIAAS
jgi:hypothetical protein